MIADVAFLVAALLYGAAAALYSVFLWRGSGPPVRWAPRMLASAVVAHVGHAVAEQLAGRGWTSDIRSTLSLLSLLIGAGYLVGSLRRPRLAALGAFVAPLTLLLFLGASLPSRVAHVSPSVRSALLPLHITVNVLGIVAFALAFAAAIAYVIEEHLLRHKRIGGLFHRLPPLDVLDSLGLKLVMIGFPLFTLGVITGSIWAARLDAAEVLFPAQGFAVLAWIFFAVVLLARLVVGWRGRRAAIGTMLGFLCSMAALAGYVLRDTRGLLP